LPLQDLFFFLFFYCTEAHNIIMTLSPFVRPYLLV